MKNLSNRKGQKVHVLDGKSDTRQDTKRKGIWATSTCFIYPERERHFEFVKFLGLDGVEVDGVHCALGTEEGCQGKESYPIR